MALKAGDTQLFWNWSGGYDLREEGVYFGTLQKGMCEQWMGDWETMCSSLTW